MLFRSPFMTDLAKRRSYSSWHYNGNGIGLMLAVKPENVERVKELLDEPVYEIGRIVKKDGASVVIK